MFSIGAQENARLSSLGRQTRTGLDAERGGTMLEIVLSLAIFAVLLASGIPSLAELAGSYNFNNSRRDFEFDIRRAQARAVADGARSVISFNDNNSGYSFGVDYLPYNNPPAADAVRFSRELPENTVLYAGSPLVFDSRGVLVDTAGDPSTKYFYMSGLSQGCSATLYVSGYIDYDCYSYDY